VTNFKLILQYLYSETEGCRDNIGIADLKSEIRIWDTGFPPLRPEFEPRSSHVGLMVNKMALWQVCFEYFCPCQFLPHQLLHIHPITDAIWS
jgi:hypothetical protein